MDICQLAPPKETYSSVFTHKNVFRLMQVMRQDKANPIIPLLDKARKAIEYNNIRLIQAIYKSKTSIVDDMGLVIHDSKQGGIETFKTEMIKTFKSANHVKDVKYTAHTNANVMNWNIFNRGILNNDSNFINDNDVLTCYTTVVDNVLERIIANSMNYNVVHCNDFVKNRLKGYLIQLEDIKTAKTTPYMFVLDHTDEESMFIFVKNIVRLKAKCARMKNFKEYYTYKNQFLLMVDIKDSNDKLIVGKDLDYSYALTVYKTQGSTYKTTFINVGNIIYDIRGKPRPIVIANRLLYVAMSRASNVTHFLI